MREFVGPYRIDGALGHGGMGVKPSNVLVDSQRRVKLMDFGIALLIGDKRLTQSSQTIGTPAYMSPEQILRPREMDHRSERLALWVATALLGGVGLGVGAVFTARHFMTTPPQDPPAAGEVTQLHSPKEVSPQSDSRTPETSPEDSSVSARVPESISTPDSQLKPDVAAKDHSRERRQVDEEQTRKTPDPPRSGNVSLPKPPTATAEEHSVETRYTDEARAREGSASTAGFSPTASFFVGEDTDFSKSHLRASQRGAAESAPTC